MTRDERTLMALSKFMWQAVNDVEFPFGLVNRGMVEEIERLKTKLGKKYDATNQTWEPLEEEA